MLTLYQRNYRRLEPLLGRSLSELRTGTVYRLQADGFIELVIEILPRDRQTGGVVLSLAHYYKQAGDLCQDPEMVVRAIPPRDGHPGLLEALRFQQAVPPVHHVVYPEPGMVVPELQRELNRFLATWLRNLKQQGHRLAPGSA